MSPMQVVGVGLNDRKKFVLLCVLNNGAQVCLTSYIQECFLREDCARVNAELAAPHAGAVVPDAGWNVQEACEAIRMESDSAIVKFLWMSSADIVLVYVG